MSGDADPRARTPRRCARRYHGCRWATVQTTTSPALSVRAVCAAGCAPVRSAGSSVRGAPPTAVANIPPAAGPTPPDAAAVPTPPRPRTVLHPRGEGQRAEGAAPIRDGLLRRVIATAAPGGEARPQTAVGTAALKQDDGRGMASGRGCVIGSPPQTRCLARRFTPLGPARPPYSSAVPRNTGTALPPTVARTPSGPRRAAARRRLGRPISSPWLTS